MSSYVSEASELPRILLIGSWVNKRCHEVSESPQKSPLAAGVRPERVANGTLWQYCVPKDARR